MILKSKISLAVGAVLTILACGTLSAQTMVPVSVTATGELSNGMNQSQPALSNAGHVVFGSKATNYVANDTTSESYDVFLKDTNTGAIERISEATDGTESNGNTNSAAAISDDGNIVYFTSSANNLTMDSIDVLGQIFVRDRQTGITSLISKGIDGQPADGFSTSLDASADGNLVVFRSTATNLTADLSSGFNSIFLFNRTTNEMRLISQTSEGLANGNSYNPTISADGNRIAYESSATNLDPNDTSSTTDIYLYDLTTEKTQLVSISTTGNGGNSVSGGVKLSSDGSLVVFHSLASNLVSGDLNGSFDVFLRDIKNSKTDRISIAKTGVEGDKSSTYPSISDDGALIGFKSSATNLIDSDNNGRDDAFLYNRNESTMIRLSQLEDGTEGNSSSASFGPVLSNDGRLVAFDTSASNFIANDTNGVRDYVIVSLVADQPPTLTITSPATTDIIYNDDVVTFTASAIDDEDGDISYKVSWSSDIDGDLASSGDSLSEGEHIITASIKDSFGNIVAVTLDITVNRRELTYCASKGNNTRYEWIQAVSFESFYNESGSNLGYLDATEQGDIELSKGYVQGSLTPGFKYGSYSEYWQIWIDFNQDGVFTNEEHVHNHVSRGSDAISFIIPESAKIGKTRLRIAMKYGSPPSPCGNFTYGEVEDYSLFIKP